MTLQDAGELTPGDTLTGDVCIVGGGVAGVTLAMTLAESGARIIVLESGGVGSTGAVLDVSIALARLRRSQPFSGGRNVGMTYYPLRFSQACAIGGSSHAWARHGMQAAPLDEIDFLAREGFDWHGWPFGRDHLDHWYQRAQRLCNLGPFDYEAESWARRGMGTVLPLSNEEARSTIFQFTLDGGFDRFVPILQSAPTARVVTHATAVVIAVDATGAVTGIECAASGGNRITVDADTYVLAAGAIENARLLLSSTDRQAHGIGNEHDLVGRCFMEHPDLSVGFMIPDGTMSIEDFALYSSQPFSDNVAGRAMLRPSDAVLRDDQLLNAVLRLRPTHPTAMASPVRSAQVLRRSLHHAVRTKGLWRHAARSLGGVPEMVEHVRRKRSTEPTVLALDLMSEQRPNPLSRVRLDERCDRLGRRRALLDWRLHPDDWRSMHEASERLAGSLERAGIGRVVRTWDGASCPVFGNWHRLGTTRMHADPAKGVVDEHCRVHGVDNLFVAGGSVFPTGGYANPTLTIVALALRLADHLSTRHRGHELAASEN